MRKSEFFDSGKLQFEIKQEALNSLAVLICFCFSSLKQEMNLAPFFTFENDRSFTLGTILLM